MSDLQLENMTTITQKVIVNIYNDLTSVFNNKLRDLNYLSCRYSFAYTMVGRAAKLISDICDNPEEMEKYKINTEGSLRFTFIIGRTRSIKIWCDENEEWHWSLDSIVSEALHWDDGIIPRGTSLAEVLFTTMFGITKTLSINSLGAEFFTLVENDRSNNFYLKAVGFTDVE